MAKKSLTVVLMSAILLTFTGSAYSGWGPKKDKFGPIVIEAHPWGDCSNSRSIDTPPSYRPGLGAGFQDFVITVTTSFTVHFYLNYVVKDKKDGQSSIRYNGKSD